MKLVMRNGMVESQMNFVLRVVGLVAVKCVEEWAIQKVMA